jgi:AraC family transcriptional regulator
VKVNWKTKFKTSPILFRRFAEWSGIKLRHFRIVPGEMHEQKPQRHEINVALAGRLTTVKRMPSGGVRKRFGGAGDGNVCLTEAGQPVSAFWNCEIENVRIEIEPEHLSRAALENSFSPHFELVEPPEMRDHLIQHIALQLLDEAQSESPAGRLYADSLVQTLTLHLLKNYSTAAMATRFSRESAVAAASGGLSGYKLRRVREFINENLDEDLSLAEIAAVADLSQYHFARAFRKTTGLTPQQYLMRQRIERAKELLAKDDLPLVEVSLRAGFKNQSHFTTLFRKFTKLTPKTWRELKLA